MAETIMPGFDRYPKEGDLIGRMLAGYGELELEMCACVAATTGDLGDAIKTLFRTRGELRRINTADKQMRTAYTVNGFGPKYRLTISNMGWCRRIRNQYAHCNWYDTLAEGLCFIDLEHTATLKRKITQVTRHRYPIDANLLARQEAYFKYVQKCFWFLGEAYQIKQGKKPSAGAMHTWPARINRPPTHN